MGRGKFFLIVVPVLVVMQFIGAGCRSTDYHRDAAVQRARKFLLEEEQDLTVLQREYVRYNKPLILAQDILGKYSNHRSSVLSTALSQICVAWIIPEQEDAYLVFGVSGNNLWDWSPNRLIIKKFTQPDRKRLTAVQSAMLYAMNNMLYLSTEQRNRIRFGVPEIITTNFIVDYSAMGENSPQKIESLKAMKQTTFVWKSLEPDKKIVVVGLGASDLGGWQPVFGQEIVDAELNDHKVK